MNKTGNENIYAPKGFCTSSIMMHVNRLKHVLKIDDKVPLWLRIRYVKEKLEDPNYEPDVFIPDNKAICDLALEHSGWLEYISNLLDFYCNNPCKHLDRDIITPEMYDLFRFSLSNIDVPIKLWTNRYLLHKMSLVKKLLTVDVPFQLWANEYMLMLYHMYPKIFGTKPLTERQAIEVIAKFMPLLDKLLQAARIISNLKREFSHNECYLCHFPKIPKNLSIDKFGITHVNICNSCMEKHKKIKAEDTFPFGSILMTKKPLTIYNIVHNQNTKLNKIEFEELSTKYHRFFTAKDGNNIFTIDPLTDDQATKVIDLFSKWLVNEHI